MRFHFFRLSWRLLPLQTIDVFCRFSPFQSSAISLHGTPRFRRRWRRFIPFLWSQRYIFISYTRSKMRFPSTLRTGRKEAICPSLSMLVTSVFPETFTPIIPFCADIRELLQEKYFLNLINYRYWTFLSESSSLLHICFKVGSSKSLNWLIDMDRAICWLSTVFLPVFSNNWEILGQRFATLTKVARRWSRWLRKSIE